MNEPGCKDVQDWFVTTLRNATSPLPTPAIRLHVADCSVCRGALATLVASTGFVPTALSHDECLNDLAGYIELEQSSPVAALHEYPHVWWHLLLCPDCAEDYRLSRALVAADQRGEISLPPLDAPLRTVPPPAQRQRLTTLSRSFLRVALPVWLPQLGTARGDHDDGAVLVDREEVNKGRLISLIVYQLAAEHYTLEVTIDPPPQGMLVITLGQQRFRAPFDLQGQARIPRIPADLLAASDGPDLLLELEHEVGGERAG